MRRALHVLLTVLVSCAGRPSPDDARPVLGAEIAPVRTPAPEPSTSELASNASADAPTVATTQVETDAGLGSYRDVSSGEVWAYVREDEAKRLARDDASLLAAPSYGRPGAFTVYDARDDDERTRSDAFKTLVYHQGFARQRLVWPDLAGGVLQRAEGAFVAVRITLAEDTLVVDLDQRDVRDLRGAPVSIDVATASPERVGLVHFRAGALRAYALVNARVVRRLEVGGEAVRAAFDDQLARLRRAVQRLDAADPFATVKLLESLRAAFAEVPPGNLMRIEDRLVALERLRAFAVEPWSRAVSAAPFRLGVATSPRIAACRKLFHAGRKLAADEWCGTGAMPYHYCSSGCEMSAGGGCHPVAESF